LIGIRVGVASLFHSRHKLAMKMLTSTPEAAVESTMTSALRCKKLRRQMASVRLPALAALLLTVAGTAFVNPGHFACQRATRSLPRRARAAQMSPAAVEPESELEYLPMKMASFATGVLRPFFVVQAAVQAGRYDKWAVRAALEAEITSAPLVIYTYEWSPFSSEAKKLLDSMGADYKEISLGYEWFLASEEQAAKRNELGAMYGRTSMPHIFIGGKSVGGLMDGAPGLVPLKQTGELVPSLKQAGAMPDEGLFGFFLYSGDHRDD